MPASKTMTILMALLVAGSVTACAIIEPGDDEPTIDELLAAPLTIDLGGKTLRLTTAMWRDFQPISPPDGKPLIAVFYVMTTDSTEFPAGVRFDHAWVVLERQVWSTGFTGEERPPSEQLSWQQVEVARNGPRFGPGVTAEAVVRVRDADGETCLLRATDQPIERTD